MLNFFVSMAEKSGLERKAGSVRFDKMLLQDFLLECIFRYPDSIGHKGKS
jgi:hypothetical protein